MESLFYDQMLLQSGVDVPLMDQLYGTPQYKGEPLLPFQTGPMDLDTVLNNSPDPYQDLSDTDLLNAPVYQDPPPPTPPPATGPQDDQIRQDGSLGPGDDATWAAFFDVLGGFPDGQRSRDPRLRVMATKFLAHY